MKEKILTKEEYIEKLNSIIRPVIDFAMSTKQFSDKGYYTEEFVKVGDQEITLAVVDKNWVLINNDVFDDMHLYRTRYHKLEKAYEELLRECESLKAKSRKKFFGIF